MQVEESILREAQAIVDSGKATSVDEVLREGLRLVQDKIKHRNLQDLIASRMNTKDEDYIDITDPGSLLKLARDETS